MTDTIEVAKTCSTCNWKTQSYSFQYGDRVWHTDCDNDFVFYSGGPIGNFFRFCPYCGKPISEVLEDLELENSSYGEVV